MTDIAVLFLRAISNFIVNYQLYIATVLEGLDPTVAECFASRLARACCPTSDAGPIGICQPFPYVLARSARLFAGLK